MVVRSKIIHHNNDSDKIRFEPRPDTYGLCFHRSLNFKPITFFQECHCISRISYKPLLWIQNTGLPIKTRRQKNICLFTVATF